MHLEITEVVWGFYLQELWWIFNSFSLTPKYLYEDCTIAKSSATAKFCTNYEINIFKGCDDAIVSGVQSSWPKVNLVCYKPITFFLFLEAFF